MNRSNYMRGNRKWCIVISTDFRKKSRTLVLENSCQFKLPPSACDFTEFLVKRPSTSRFSISILNRDPVSSFQEPYTFSPDFTVSVTNFAISYQSKSARATKTKVSKHNFLILFCHFHRSSAIMFGYNTRTGFNPNPSENTNQ